MMCSLLFLASAAMSVRARLNTSAFVVILLVASLAALPSLAAEPGEIRPVDLVGSDAALICEVSRPAAHWDAFRQSALFRRFERSAYYEELLTSPGFRQWRNVEQGVAAATGHPLSSQLLDLFSRELVLAAYLSDRNQPQGVLIARSEHAGAVERFLQTWKTLEPSVAAQPRRHLGETYYLRPASSGRKANLFYVTFGPVFAISDHESRIQQVIELQQVEVDGSRASPERLTQQPMYRRVTPHSAEDSPPMRMLLFARAWDQVWQDTSNSDAGAALLRRVWPAVDAIALDVRTTEGLHLELRGLLNSDQTDDRWKAWSETTPPPRAFLPQVPDQAVLVAAGGIHFEPFWRFLHELASESDREEWKKGRRFLRGILGGRDLLDDVLPALTRQIGCYLVPLADGNEAFPFDGVLTIQFSEDEQSTGLHLALDQALSAGLMLLAVQSAETFPNEAPATVQTDLSAGTISRWLETRRPLRVAYQITPTTLRVSRSINRLRDDGEASAPAASSFFAASLERWFPDADQFVCLDLKTLRDLRRSSDAFSAILARPQDAEESAPQWLMPMLDLGDTVYFATQFEASHLTVRLGVAVDSDR